MRFVKVLLAAGVLAAVVAPSAMAFRFDDAARLTPTGVTGQPYFHKLGTVAGCKGVYMNVLSGALPPGLRLVGNKRDDVDGSDWRIEGTPTTPGEYGFWIQAKNLCEGDSTEEDFKIVVVSGLAIQQSVMPVGTAGVPYPATTLTATGGGTHTWSLVAGSSLPAGMTLAPNGVVSGMPSAPVAGHQTKVAVTDGSRRSEQTLTFNIRADLAVSAKPVPTAAIDKAFTYNGLAVTGGSGGNSWSIVGAPAPGIAIDPATGVLTGTPTQAGSFRIVIRVTDNEGRAKEVPLVIRVASPVEITNRRVITLRAGRLYSYAIRTEGGVGIPRYGRDTFNWKVLEGRLPLGLRLNTRVGKLIGRPRRAGTFEITLRVQDRFRSEDTQELVIRVLRSRR